jgi:hypothetical protein
MNAFMLWMSGSGVQIFSIMITVMLLYNPFKAIFSVQKGTRKHYLLSAYLLLTFSNVVFEPFQITKKNKKSAGQLDTGDPIFVPKIVFILCQLGVVSLGVWKCQSMGLLPTATSDWLAFMPAKVPVESMAVAVLLS